VTHEVNRRFEREDQRALAADKRPCDVEPVFRQQRRQVVAGYAARDVGKLPPDHGRVLVLKFLHAPEDLRVSAAVGEHPLIAGLADCAEPHPNTPIRQHVQALDVIRGRWAGAIEGRLHRMHTAGVVANHAAERAAAMAARVGTERQPLLCGGRSQMVEGDTRLETRGLRRRIDREDPIEVLGRVDDDCRVAALARDAGSPAAGQDRRTVRSARLDGGDDVVDVAGNHDANGRLAIVRRVCGIERAIDVVESDLAGDGRAEIVGQ
jgi:hypothetical protein